MLSDLGSKIAAILRKGSLFSSFALTFLIAANLGAEGSDALIDKIRANSFSVAPSASLSPSEMNQAVDPRSAEIAKRLRERLTAIRTPKDESQTTPRVFHKAKDGHKRPSEYLNRPLEVRMHAKAGTPRQISGKMLQPAVRDTAKSKEDRDKKTARAFLQAYRHLLRLKDPDRELDLSRIERDKLDRRHLRFSQIYHGLPVWPAELIVHLAPEGHVDLMSGAYIPTPRKLITQPALDARAATARARDVVPGGNDAEVSNPTLIIYAPRDRMPRLAWKLKVNVSIASHWLVVIDALNGVTLDAYNQIMEADVAGSGMDLFGVTQPLHVWEEGDKFYMVDTSKPMFDSISDPPNPDTTRGGIVIFDAKNQGPGGDFSLFYVTSESRTLWDLPDAVSAAFGLSETYDYYREHHGRDSLDGQGGTIIAVVRIGQGYENAFWNGRFMVFGDARPFAGALDVVGHELTHGVTQHTANLVYQNQPGALNEAFSDIFGEMVELRTKGSLDWLKGGTDLGVTIQNYANPTAVECLSEVPCPSKMSKFIDTSLDNGGVHLNSSIINHAFYLLAEGLPGAIGVDDAEQIFYQTLTTKLTKQSEFIDARLGAIASAKELFGNDSLQARTVAEAFDAVEIFDAPPTPEPRPIPPVSGPNATLFVVFDPEDSAFFLARREEALGDGPQGKRLSRFDITQSRPSVSGDGSLAMFVDSVNDVCFIRTDGTEEEEKCLGSPRTFFSAAMSPDEKWFALVLLDENGEPENKIRLMNLDEEVTRDFPLKAPLIDSGTIEVLHADALDFTRNGQVLIYDAFNIFHLEDGSQLGLWSIYALDIATETVTTLVAPTPGLDIANPSISQTSDNFITFEAVNPATGESTILVQNLFIGDLKELLTVSMGGFFIAPGYTGDDAAIVFSEKDDTPTGTSLFQLPLAQDRATPIGAPELWMSDASFGVIYRRGSFAPPGAFSLTVTKAGNGLVTGSPAGINCGNACTKSYDSGTVVTLIAEADDGSTFAGWSGACSGTDTCMVTMDTDKSVMASFTTSPRIPTVSTGSATSVASASATLNGTVNPNGLNTAYYFDYGKTINYGSTTPITSIGSVVNSVSVTANIVGLDPKTIYHYRLVAMNSIGTSSGNDQTFTSNEPCSTIPINLGDAKAGDLSETDCDAPHRTGRFADLYTFSGNAGQQVVITMFSSDFETHLLLQAPDGAVIASDDGCCLERGSKPSSFSSSYIPYDYLVDVGLTLPSSGTYTIEVTSHSEAKIGTYQVGLALPLSFVSMSLEVGTPYNVPLIIGGIPPYFISIWKGSLPDGLDIDSTGYISGTPTKAGSKKFTIQLSDYSSTFTVWQKFQITVFKALRISTKRLPKGKLRKKYNVTLQATGGKKPYAWTYGGSLPEGLSLDRSTGKITGIPEKPGEFNLTFQVTDPLGGKAQQNLTFTIP